jgi:hypothetical protein
MKIIRYLAFMVFKTGTYWPHIVDGILIVPGYRIFWQSLFIGIGTISDCKFFSPKSKTRVLDFLTGTGMFYHSTQYVEVA